MRIGIDARFYGPVGKGLGRYTEKLVGYLEQVADPDDRFFIFLRKENFDSYVPGNPRFRKVLADYPWYSVREQVFLPFLLGRYRLDLVHFPHFNVPIFYGRPFVVTIHDLILLRFPTVRNTTRSRYTYRLKYAAYRLAIASAIGKARTILTVSNFTEQDILATFPEAKGKTIVAYEGCDFGADAGGPVGSSISAGHGILAPYFLYVGNAYPHKNLEAFISLAARFREVMFVLVGKGDYFYGRLRGAVESAGIRNIVFTGFVPDAELSGLYRGATGYLFPSLYEGFGLPPLEAMRFGIPVIAARRGSLPEILGEAALYFDPDDSDDLAKKVGEILNDPRLVSELAKKGKDRATMFRWRDMADVTYDAYRRAREG